MTDGTDHYEDEGNRLGDTSGTDTEGFYEEPPSYRSGRVRIIGAEPAGDAVREVTGPVVEEHPELLHWNDPPTGQVPAILDRSTGEEQAVAPPTWREESTDWEAQEEVFEPAMLSDDLPAVGALLGESEIDVERAPWHFESDDTLVIPPEPGLEPEPPAPAEPAARVEEPVAWDQAPAARVQEPSAPVQEPASWVEEPVAWDQAPPARVQEPSAPVQEPASWVQEPPDWVPEQSEPESVEVAPRRQDSPGVRRRVSSVTSSSAAAASRLSPPKPPEPPETRTRVPRRTRAGANVRTGNVSTAGTGGRDMRLAIGSGVFFGVLALVCFALGTVATMFIVCVALLLATAEGYAAFRRARYHPATLLGLVAVLSLLIETYNKGVAALPLVLVLLVAGSFIWYLARVEPAAEPVPGITSTVFVFVWVGAFGSFAALLLNPNLFPDRHGIAFLLAAVIVTVADDVASLLVGSAIGRHQLAPSISPNKSWEGLIGGAVAAIFVSVVVVHFIHPWTLGKAAVYGVVVAVVAPLGDLSQSMIKRHLGLKDMGRLLPGHGGILDRVDGLLFVVPATYFVVKAMHLG